MDTTMRKFALAAILMAGTAAAAHATPTFTTIDNPKDPTFNQLLGINDFGTIVGYFGSGMQTGHPNKGYLTKPPYSSFKAVNAPGSVQTQITGINNAGLVSGFWSNTNLGSGDANFAFLGVRFNHHYAFVSSIDPHTGGQPLVAQMLGVNKYDVGAGFWVDAAGHSHGYLYNFNTGSYTELSVPGAQQVAATGINDNGVVCGFIVTSKGVTEGFTQNASGGVVSLFEVPNSTNTQLLGINNSGVAVGFYADANNITHGIVYTPANGNWTQLDDPNGVDGTVINGLNNKGQAVGFYTDGTGNVNGMLIDGLP